MISKWPTLRIVKLLGEPLQLLYSNFQLSSPSAMMEFLRRETPLAGSGNDRLFATFTASVISCPSISSEESEVMLEKLEEPLGRSNDEARRLWLDGDRAEALHDGSDEDLITGIGTRNYK